MPSLGASRLSRQNRGGQFNPMLPIYQRSNLMTNYQATPHNIEVRREENRVLMASLEELNDGRSLAILASLIRDHDHLWVVLHTTSDSVERRAKFEAMRPYLRFTPYDFLWYDLPRQARGIEHHEIQTKIMDRV